MRRIGCMLLVCLLANTASAGIIGFNAEFEVTGTSGNFSSELIGNTYSSTIDVDDTCGSNSFFNCSSSNAVLNFLFEGIDLGTNAGWSTILYSAMSDYGNSASIPFTYNDPVYNDVLFRFDSNDLSIFRASSINENDNTWFYIDASGNRVDGIFGVVSRIESVPEPSSIALLGLGMLGLLFRRRSV